MIDELDALYMQATPGEWVKEKEPPSSGFISVYVPNVGPCRMIKTVADANPEDAAFIVAMHNAWPTLRDRRELRAAIQSGMRSDERTTGLSFEAQEACEAYDKAVSE